MCGGGGGGAGWRRGETEVDGGEGEGAELELKREREKGGGGGSQGDNQVPSPGCRLTLQAGANARLSLFAPSVFAKRSAKSGWKMGEVGTNAGLSGDV